MSRALKTTRNLSQFAEKKLVGKGHTSANKTDNAEDIPSNIQLTTKTIFGEAVPSGPSAPPTTTLWAVTSTVQKVQFDVEEIPLTRYDADASTEAGGDDSPQSTGPHGWALKLTSDYESNSTTGGTKHHTKVGSAPFVNSTKVSNTIGSLQLVPTNVYINTSDPANNPYIPKIYTWDGSDASTKSSVPLTISDHLDWFVDSYAGIVFFQEYDGRVPYKVEAYIYVGDMADETSMATTLAGLTDTNITSPSNDQVLAYNSSASKWEPQTINTGTGVAQYVKEASGVTSAGSALVIPGMNFSGKNPTAPEVQVYLNGALIHSGSTAEVNGGDADYRLDGTTGVIFGFDIQSDDLVTVNYIDSAFSTGKTILLHTEDTAFSDGRVLTAGDGISISNATPRQLIVNNTGLVQRTKVHVVASTGYSTNSTFTVGNSIDFSFSNASYKYSDSRIDIFKNGVLLFKDVDFQLKDQESSLNNDQFKLIGSLSISNSDRITVILF